MPPLAEIFGFTLHPGEIVLRGTAVYWALFALFRFVLRRDVGALGIADVLLVVLIADAAQNAMAGQAHSVGDGLLLVATLAGWAWLLDAAAFRWEAVRRFAEARPIVLVRHGRMLRANLRREFLGEEELMSKLRQQGIEQLSEVKLAAMESDGAISVIRTQGSTDPPGPVPRSRPPGAGG